MFVTSEMLKTIARLASGDLGSFTREAIPSVAADGAIATLTGGRFSTRIKFIASIAAWVTVNSSIAAKKHVKLIGMGQSNEQGAARYWIPGISPVDVSFESGALSDPIAGQMPTRRCGSIWPAVRDMLGAGGVRVTGMYNGAVGSTSLRHHWVGELFNFNTWQANITVYQKRTATSYGDAGDKGSFLKIGAKLFQCTTGTLRYATINDPTTPTVISGVSYKYLDYLANGPSVKTGATTPDWASATVIGNTVADGSAVWTLVSTSSSAPLSATSTDLHWDPLGLIARCVTNSAGNAGDIKVAYFQNGQSDAYNISAYYANEAVRWGDAATNLAIYLRARDIYVWIGNSSAVVGETIMANGKYPSQCAQDGANACLVTMASFVGVYRGADWWAEWGPNPPCYPESGTADTGTRVHLRAQAITRAAAAVADSILAGAILQ